MTIGNQITINVVITAVLLAGLTAYTEFEFNKIHKNSEILIEDCIPSTEHANKIEENALKIYAALQRCVISTSPEDFDAAKKELSTYREQNNAVTRGYQAMLANMPEKKVLFDVVIEKLAKCREAQDKVLALCEAGNKSEAAVTTATVARPAFNALEQAIQALLVLNVREIGSASNNIKSTLVGAERGVIIISVLLFVINAGVGLITVLNTNRVLRHVSSTLDENSNNVASAASEIASSSHQLADGASQQAAALEETSASMEEMASMIKRNSENAQSGHDKAMSAHKATEQGASDMLALIAAMSEMSKIIKSIDEIAFQTNILSLNAAVEAARAGEAGAGFAVVADEVRSLARRSADAASETASRIEQGVKLTEKVKNSLDELVQEMKEVDSLVAEIALASKEQAQGIDQVNMAIGQMDRTTQSTAANTEETASASEELRAQSVGLNEAVQELISLVGRKGATVHSVKREEKNITPASTPEAAKTKPVKQLAKSTASSQKLRLPM